MSDYPAFPISEECDFSGLSGRQYASVHLLAGLLAARGETPLTKESRQDLVRCAVETADALMVELNK